MSNELTSALEEALGLVETAAISNPKDNKKEVENTMDAFGYLFGQQRESLSEIDAALCDTIAYMVASLSPNERSQVLANHRLTDSWKKYFANCEINENEWKNWSVEETIALGKEKAARCKLATTK